MATKAKISPVITLLTDFGTRDGYVGAMKGVLSSMCPGAIIIDITHDIGACDIFEGALALQASAPRFSEDAVHVAVVDPGVGTSRRPLVVTSECGTFVGPDNGLLSLAAATPRKVYHLDRDEFFLAEVSRTFHGRDIFAPVAARLAAGASPAELGTEVESMASLDLPAPRIEDGVSLGSIIHTDHFGNLITSLRQEHLAGLPDELAVEVAGRTIRGLSATYADVPEGGLVALIGSAGYLEIAVRGGSASQRLGIEHAWVKTVRVGTVDALRG